LILGPPGLILLGAVIAAIGGFWAASKQSISSTELRASNKEIKSLNQRILELQQENLNNIRGADFCFILASDQFNQDGSFNFNLIAPNKLPVFDVYLKIIKDVNAPIDTPEQQHKLLNNISNPIIINVGNMSAWGVRKIDVSLSPGYYQIDIRTRNAKYLEMLKFDLFHGGLGQSMIVSDFHGNVLQKSTSPEDLPSIYQ